MYYLTSVFIADAVFLTMTLFLFKLNLIVNIKGLFELHLDVYNSSQRNDLDNSLKGTLDCLQACKAIENDRNCVKIVAQKFVDKVNPRIEFTIKEI